MAIGLALSGSVLTGCGTDDPAATPDGVQLIDGKVCGLFDASELGAALGTNAYRADTNGYDEGSQLARRGPSRILECFVELGTGSGADTLLQFGGDDVMSRDEWRRDRDQLDAAYRSSLHNIAFAKRQGLPTGGRECLRPAAITSVGHGYACLTKSQTDVHLLLSDYNLNVTLYGVPRDPGKHGRKAIARAVALIQDAAANLAAADHRASGT